MAAIAPQMKIPASQEGKRFFAIMGMSFSGSDKLFKVNYIIKLKRQTFTARVDKDLSLLCAYQ